MIILTVPSYRKATILLILSVCFETASPESCGDFIFRRKLIGQAHTNIESKENYSLDIDAKIVGNDTYDVTFNCRNDFLLQGPNQARCLPNGSWSQEIPKCLEQCANLVNIENIQVSTTNRTINSTVELSCKLPEYAFKGPKKLYCKHGGWWSEKKKLYTADYPSCRFAACVHFIYRKKSIGNTYIESIENYSLDLEAKYEGHETYDVTFFCRNYFLLQGPNQARCFPNGSWSREIPRCLEQCTNLVNIENIQVSTNQRTINSTVELSCKLPKYEFKGPQKLYCKHGGWWTDKHKLEKAAYPSCKVKPTYTSWKVYLIITGCVAGAILILIIFLGVCIWTRRKHGKDIDGEVKAHPELLKSMFCVKVWSADREKRKVIVTEDYKSLRNSVCLEFNINGRLVLEEDGTEIENDESLLRYKDKTLMVLAKNELWKNSRSRQYNSSQSAAFHVFSNDRQKSMEDLGEQALHMHGYKPQRICLEIDGTNLESEHDLKAFTGHRLMAVKKGCTRTVPQDGDFPHSSHYSGNQERHMFIVRSLDGRKRKEIFASNVVGLHFAAATALRLHPPVEVTTNNGVLISDDVTLSQHINDVLTVTEVCRSRKLLLQNDTPRSSSVYSA